MKRCLMTLALTSVLSMSAWAGEIPTTDSPAPAPSGTPQGISIQTSSLPGELPTTDAAQQLWDATLSALLAVLRFI